MFQIQTFDGRKVGVSKKEFITNSYGKVIRLKDGKVVGINPLTYPITPDYEKVEDLKEKQ